MHPKREGWFAVQPCNERRSISDEPYGHLRISRILTRLLCSSSGSPDPSGGATTVGEAAGRPGCIPFEEGWAGGPGSRTRLAVMPLMPCEIPRKVPAL